VGATKLAAGGGGLALPSLLKILTYPQPPVCRQTTQASGNQSVDITGSETFIHTEAQVLYQLGNHDQIPRLLASRKIKNSIGAEFIKGCDLSQELTPENTWVKMMLFPLQDILVQFVHQQQR